MASLFAAKSANGAFRALRPQARRPISVQRNLLRGAVVLAALPAEKKAEVLTTVRKVIATQLSIEPEKVMAESTFVDLNADSLDTVEIMMALEEAFGVELGEEDANGIATVGAASDVLCKAIEDKASA